MHTFLLGLVLLAPALLPQDDKQNPSGREGAERAGMTGPRIDGTWTVVAMERMGQPAAAGAHATVTIRNNVVTFGGMTSPGAARPDAGGTRGEGAGRADAAMHQAWRLEFLGHGTVRATPVAGAAGATDRSGTATGRTGTRDTSKAGTRAAGSERTGADAAQAAHGPQTGVYVQTRDYLCISFNGGQAGDAGRTGATGGAPADSDRRGTDAGSGRGAGTGARAGDGSGAHGQASFALILRRQGAGAGSGSGTGSDR
jgi:hypothetical protein